MKKHTKKQLEAWVNAKPDQLDWTKVPFWNQTYNPPLKVRLLKLFRKRVRSGLTFNIKALSYDRHRLP